MDFHLPEFIGWEDRHEPSIGYFPAADGSEQCAYSPLGCPHHHHDRCFFCWLTFSASRKTLRAPSDLVLLNERFNGVNRCGIACSAQTRHYRSSTHRDVGAVIDRFTPVNIADVKFDYRTGKHL